jgi:two-component system, chemotaxis family, response regulator WspR
VTPNTGAAPRPSDRSALRGLAPTVRDAKGRVRHESLTDSLTELPNRLHFDVVYRLLWEAGGRGIPVTLLRFDLPGFGQAPADVQRRVGERLNLITRQMDMIARLEPDRFGVLLMDCNAFGGMVAAERFGGDLGAILDELKIPFHSGLAAWKDWMTKPEDLMGAADEALEVARSRNERVEVHHR